MKCDKCGLEVQDRDDAVLLESEALKTPVFFQKARHIRCSPSRAQYVVHPRFPPVVDDRPRYDKRLKDDFYVATQELAWTFAWIKAQGV